MSTRSMVIVAQPYTGQYGQEAPFVPLYRHCDGYPAGCGQAILDAIKDATCPEDVLSRLLALRYDRGEPVYRAATWLPEEQGDLEHVYELRPATVEDVVTSGRIRPAVISWTVKHYIRNGWASGSDDYRHWAAAVQTPQEFALLVEIERKEIDRRTVARSQNQG